MRPLNDAFKETRLPKAPTDAVRRAIAREIREDGPAEMASLIRRFVPVYVRAFVNVDRVARAVCSFVADWIDPDTADPNVQITVVS